MRHGILWTLVLLGLPQVAVAGGAVGAAVPPVFPGIAPAIERAEAPAPTAPSDLDLRIDPAPLPSAQGRPYGAPAIEGDWADLNAEQDAADRGLSFGLEVKPRSRIGALARQNETEDSGLGGQIERLIERPVFGLRGRYRF
jgi:hypothetical protein